MQLGLDAVQGRDPLTGQVMQVARPVEALGAVEKVVVVLVPTDALAGLEGAKQLGQRAQRTHRGLETPGDEHGTVLLRHQQRLIRAHGIAVTFGVVGDVPTCRLCPQPLADVALGGAGALRELAGPQRRLGSRQ
jgi:hypothetical protein